MDKFKSRLPRDDLKRFAKEVSKKLVASDFKNKRVTDPTKISEKQERSVRKYVQEYFEKAVQKKVEHDKRKKKEATGKDDTAAYGSKLAHTSEVMANQQQHESATVDRATTDPRRPSVREAEEDIVLSENEIEPDEDDDDDDQDNDNDTEAPTSNGTKRKRSLGDGQDTPLTPADEMSGPSSTKKVCEGDAEMEPSAPIPPPPPPPPPPEVENACEDENMELRMDVDMNMDTGHATTHKKGEHASKQVSTEPNDEGERPVDGKGDGSESFTKEARDAVQGAEEKMQAQVVQTNVAVR